MRADSTYRRKYPTGDWMTSPQVFEEVKHPLTALQLLDVTVGGVGVLYLHDGSQSMLRRGELVENILTLYDPWDEGYFVADFEARTRLVPHGPIAHAESYRFAQEFTRPPVVVHPTARAGDLPALFGAVHSGASNVVITACYREVADVGRDFLNYAGRNLGYPYVLRLVEFNGIPTDVELEIAGHTASAYKTNLLGEIQEKLMVTDKDSGSAIRGKLGSHEIATLYLDIVEGRKVSRDLDARRSVWAQVHRTGESE